MNDLDAIRSRAVALAVIPGCITMSAEDFVALFSEIEWLRKLSCDYCSAGLPLRPDGYHVDGDELVECDAKEPEDG